MLLALTLSMLAPAMAAADQGDDRLICKYAMDPNTRMRTGSRDCRTKAEWRGKPAKSQAAAAPTPAAEASAQVMPAEPTPPQR